MQRYQTMVVLALLSAVSAYGQRPDFSGTWKERTRRDIVRIDKIEHRDAFLKITTQERSAPGSNLPLGYFGSGEVAYTLDGVEKTRNDPDRGRQLWWSAWWEDSSAVFQTITKEGYHVTVKREVLTLSEDGNTLTRTTRTINMDGVTESTLIFDRQSGRAESAGRRRLRAAL